jgi:6-pyruvoyltetrahydropterin/6-carboxytetrahydropterin synthase
MKVKLKKIFMFDAAHKLPDLEAGHKCATLHGHTYKVEILLEGPVEERKKWLIDFGEFKRIVQPVIDELDHTFLNDIPGLENPTAENICRWLWGKIKPMLPLLYEIVVWETDTSACIYNGE